MNQQSSATENAMTAQDGLHVPVLLEQVLTYLKPQKGETYLDLTAGYGGHADRIIGRTENPMGSVLVDRDENAISELQKRFISGTDLIHADFLSASRQLVDEGKGFDLILADLGLSSPHLDTASRGFSIAHDGPLDMRMDPGQELTAGMIVNQYPEAELTSLLSDYGEDPKARSIARAIIAARPVSGTAELAKVIARVWPGHSRVHPATRSFQAIRIAVNDELAQLEQALPVWFRLLNPGGRVAVISFHSLEDRLVKQALQGSAGDTYDSILRLLTKRPITAESTETVHNPRARSAKLRAAVKK